MHSPDDTLYLKHLESWLKNTNTNLQTVDGKDVEIWEYDHQNDEDILSEWAKHFCNHYCSEEEIEFLRGDLERKEYLNQYKFPSATSAPGPSIRSGDFSEILLADFFSWHFGFWVPRLRWCCKPIRNESAKGCDIIGFKFANKNVFSKDDILAICESKSNFTNASAEKSHLQDAIIDSAKDSIRLIESLNYLKQKLYDKNLKKEAKLIERFQNPTDRPYQERYTAAAVICSDVYQEGQITSADTQRLIKSPKSPPFPHPKSDKLSLVVIKGTNLKQLANDLYLRAANEA